MRGIDDENEEDGENEDNDGPTFIFKYKITKWRMTKWRMTKVKEGEDDR